MAGASLFAFAISALQRGTPAVLFGLLAVCFSLSFDAMQMGRPRLPAILLLVCFAPPAMDSPLRYRIGLIMFVTLIVLGSIGPYVPGGDFRDKLRSLFIRDARVVFPVE